VARSLTASVGNLHLKWSVGYHRTVELESIEDMFRNMYSAPDIPKLPAVDGFYIDTVERMIFLFQMTISCDHSIRFEDLIYIIEKIEPTKLAYRFALIFVVPLNIADVFPKQKITGATLFDDLKNSPVENIRGIGPILGAQLRSSPYNISTMYDFYVATQDQSRRETMTSFSSQAFHI